MCEKEEKEGEEHGGCGGSGGVGDCVPSLPPRLCERVTAELHEKLADVCGRGFPVRDAKDGSLLGHCRVLLDVFETSSGALVVRKREEFQRASPQPSSFTGANDLPKKRTSYFVARQEMIEQVALTSELRALRHIQDQCLSQQCPSHPHVLPLLTTTLGEQEGVVAAVGFSEIWTPFCAGGDLVDWTQTAPVRLTPEQTSEVARRIFRQVCQAVDFLHRRCGVVHRDIKPENVFLERSGWEEDATPAGPPGAMQVPEPHARLGDFDLACVGIGWQQPPAEEDEEEMPLFVCAKVGTPGIRAPELLTDEPSWVARDEFRVTAELVREKHVREAVESQLGRRRAEITTGMHEMHGGTNGDDATTSTDTTRKLCHARGCFDGRLSDVWSLGAMALLLSRREHLRFRDLQTNIICPFQRAAPSDAGFRALTLALEMTTGPFEPTPLEKEGRGEAEEWKRWERLRRSLPVSNDYGGGICTPEWAVRVAARALRVRPQDRCPSARHLWEAAGE